MKKSELIKKVLQLVDKQIDVDGYYGSQCVDLIMWIMLQVCNEKTWGNAIDYTHNKLPAGCNRFKKGETAIEKGDILVYGFGANDKYGHVAFVLEAFETYSKNAEANIDGNPDYLEVGGPVRIKERNYNNVVTIIRLPLENDGWAFTPFKQDIETVAKKVIEGKYGNGEERKRNLHADGFDYESVQNKVNDLLADHKIFTPEEIAKQVIDGKWGNGEIRKQRLANNGYDYYAIQSIVNELLEENPKTTLKPIDTIVDEVINGDWGNGATRKIRLEKDGYNYDAVQAIVNRLVHGSRKTDEQIVEEVWRGLWGNGLERKERLTNAGYDYNEIQKKVNEKKS